MREGIHEPTELASLARVLAWAGPLLPRHYLPGKTFFENEVSNLLDCSEEEAVELVDELERWGFIRFERGYERASGWSVVKSI